MHEGMHQAGEGSGAPEMFFGVGGSVLDLPVLRCAWCEDQAEDTVLIGARGSSFRVDLCALHLIEMMSGAREG